MRRVIGWSIPLVLIAFGLLWPLFLLILLLLVLLGLLLTVFGM